MKKLKILILVIIIFFSFFLITYFKKRSYVINYKVNKYNITEKYDKDHNTYYISVKNNKEEYFFIIENKYTKKRKLVSNIKKYKNENKKCMLISFNNEKITPSCIKDGEYISYNLVKDSFKNKIKNNFIINYKNTDNKTYKNIDINTLFNKKVLIWNYHGFYFLSKNSYKDISMFKNDTYDASLISQIDKYLLIPNYTNEYEYNKFYVLNIDTLNTKTLKLNDNISQDSYVLGSNEDSIYLFDKKYQKEYEFVPYKLKYRDVNPFIYDKGKKIEKTSLSLKNEETKFIYDTIYNYEIVDNKLYKTNIYNNHKELISNLDVKYIVKENNDLVYYLSEDSLYVYSPKYGEVLLLKYFELNFNYKNLIYIFD